MTRAAPAILVTGSSGHAAEASVSPPPPGGASTLPLLLEDPASALVSPALRDTREVGRVPRPVRADSRAVSSSREGCDS